LNRLALTDIECVEEELVGLSPEEAPQEADASTARRNPRHLEVIARCCEPRSLVPSRLI
jgi:hypothetical protein